MSNYGTSYHRSYGKSTFQGNSPDFVPGPPIPPPYFLQPPPTVSDGDIVKQFENRLTNIETVKSVSTTSISKVRDEIRNLSLALNEIKQKEKLLSEKINELSDEEWSLNLRQIDENKAIVSAILTNVNNLNTTVLRKLLAKRSSKRARQKRQRIEKNKEKEENLKLNKERSRKIDEYLQKFQDDIIKAKQEEDAKLQADVILRETIRKKQDAKKYIIKMDALVKLRKARQNTAKGRGVNVSEKEAEVFETNIEKLKSMWKQRLAVYTQEETELQAKLKQDTEDLIITKKDTEKEVLENLAKWKEVLFGGMLPQVDFAGNVGRFLKVRSQWDQYLNREGTSMPLGWVPPTAKTTTNLNST